MDGIFDKNPKTCRNICGIGQYVTGCEVLVRRDGVAPPESEDSRFTACPATTYGIPTHINPDHSWRPLGKPHRMFLLAETENQLTRKDLYISREIVPTSHL